MRFQSLYYAHTTKPPKDHAETIQGIIYLLIVELGAYCVMCINSMNPENPSFFAKRAIMDGYYICLVR